MSPPIDRDEFFLELEKTGEDEVHARFVTGCVYGHDKSPLVGLWLRLKDQERADSFKREQMEIAREAATAAREAANAARSAANTAKIVAIIAAISIIISVIIRFL